MLSERTTFTRTGAQNFWRVSNPHAHASHTRMGTHEDIQTLHCADNLAPVTACQDAPFVIWLSSDYPNLDADR